MEGKKWREIGSARRHRPIVCVIRFCAALLRLQWWCLAWKLDGCPLLSKFAYMKKKSTKSRPFSDDYLPVLLALATHAIADEFHEVISQHGLSILEWRVLASLEHGKPVATSRLATVTLTKQPTVTRLLDRLEAQGHVVRKPDLEDRRITLVQATAQGVKAIRHLVALARGHEQKVIATLTFDVDELKDKLREIIQTRNSQIPDSLPQDVAPAKPLRRLRTSSAA